MENNWENEDLRTLLDAYMRESKLFSAELQEGASWLELGGNAPADPTAPRADKQEIR